MRHTLRTLRRWDRVIDELICGWTADGPSVGFAPAQKHLFLGKEVSASGDLWIHVLAASGWKGILGSQGRGADSQEA
jgi:hypothetical protein